MTSGMVDTPRKAVGVGRQLSPEQAAAAAMVADAKARGLELTGSNGLLKLFTKNVLETALNEEMTEHLGHEKNQAEAGRESTNVRPGGMRILNQGRDLALSDACLATAPRR
jgi:putative transposase